MVLAVSLPLGAILARKPEEKLNASEEKAMDKWSRSSKEGESEKRGVGWRRSSENSY